MQLNVWGSDFFYLINKIPFNAGIKNREGGSVAGTGSLNWFVQSWGALEKLRRVAASRFPPLLLRVSRRLPCNMTLSEGRVTPVNIVMFTSCQMRH